MLMLNVECSMFKQRLVAVSDRNPATKQSQRTILRRTIAIEYWALNIHHLSFDKQKGSGKAAPLKNRPEIKPM